MLKKYMYLGVFLGAIVLAGCSANKESEKQVTEHITNGQAGKVETFHDNDKEEVGPLIPLELTQEQKEDYHKQYVEIVNEINAEDGTNHLEVVPIDEFKQEDWVEPEEFKQLATDRATWKFTSKAFGGDLVE